MIESAMDRRTNLHLVISYVDHRDNRVRSVLVLRVLVLVIVLALVLVLAILCIIGLLG